MKIIQWEIALEELIASGQNQGLRSCGFCFRRCQTKNTLTKSFDLLFLEVKKKRFAHSRISFKEHDPNSKTFQGLGSTP